MPTRWPNGLEGIANAILQVLESPNVADSNMEPANVVDAIDNVARGLFAVANAITPRDASPGKDAGGGTVASLTEAVMGVSEMLFRIVEAAERIAVVQENS